MTDRSPTAVDALADGHLDATCALDPVTATFSGVAGHDDRLPDLTPDWWASVSAERRRVLAALDTTTPVDATDRVTVAALRESLTVAEDLRAAGADESGLNVIESPLQTIRMAFDLLPTATQDDWDVVARRMAAVPHALAGYQASLDAAAARGYVSPRRQVLACAEQCTGNVGADGYFTALAAGAAASGELPAALGVQLRNAAAEAGEAYLGLQSYLRERLLPRAGEADAVGAELYALHSHHHVGARVDLRETYEWGQEEFARIRAEQAATAERIKPGATVAEAVAQLDADPERQLDGLDALQAWMQATSDEAVLALADTHFDIPEQIRTLECRIAPTHTGGIYYTPPSEDLVTRHGTMWWSVPAGQTRYTTWRERSIVYHEGVPGHHLQVAQTSYRRAELNRWRRLGSWSSGHGEGWALYAERLMAELGHLDDPGDYLGMLDSQCMRAARVVVDIGVHCGFDAPAEAGGGPWTYDKAWQFLTGNLNYSEAMLRFELDRYLGWPGQAPSYKIGERLWLQLREDARASAGASFDLRSFHRRTLDIGSVGLDVLRAAVLDER